MEGLIGTLIRFFARLSDQNMASGIGWSPRSTWQALKLDWTRNQEQVFTLAVAKARGPRYLQAAKDTLATKRYTEEIGEPLGRSRTAYQRGLKEALRGHDDLMLQGLLESAQREGMFDDILDSIFEDREIRSFLAQGGMFEEDFIQIKNNRVRTKLLTILFGTDQEGLRLIHRLQEAATKGGNYTAMDVDWNVEMEKFIAKDRNNARDREWLLNVWIRRFQGPDPWTSLPNLRKETFCDDRTLCELIARGMLAPIHMANLNRMRASTVEFLKSKLTVLLSAGPNGQLLVDEMVRRRLIPTSSHPTRIIMSYWGEINVSDLATYVFANTFMSLTSSQQIQIKKEFESQIFIKARSALPEDLARLNAQVQTNRVLNTAFKARIQQIVDHP